MKTDPLCLSIETSGIYLGLALVSFNEKLKSFQHISHLFIRTPFKQSELLFPKITELFKKLHVTKKSLGFIAVNVGPGSFTGVRVGVAAARALGQGFHIPVVGVNGLEAMAYAVPRQKKKSEDIVVSSIPALAEEVYFAVYKRNEKWR